MAVHSFALDEDVDHHVAALLRADGQDAKSAKELARLGLSDIQVLIHATEREQTLVTHNHRDFALLHEAWMTLRRRWAVEIELVTGHPVVLSRHAGILIAPQIPRLHLVRILHEFAHSAGAMDDRLFAWYPATGWQEIHVRR